MQKKKTSPFKMCSFRFSDKTTQWLAREAAATKRTRTAIMEMALNHFKNWTKRPN